MGQNWDDGLIMDCNLRRKEEISNRCDDGGGGVCGLMWSGEKIGVYGATRRSLRIVLSVVTGEAFGRGICFAKQEYESSKNSV